MKSGLIKLIIIFLLPSLLLYILFTIYPVIKTFYNSFYKIGPFKSEFIGIQNFKILLKDSIFWKSAENTVIWTISSIVLEIGLGFFLAFIIFKKIPFHRFFRAAWFLPVLLPYVVTGIMWMYIYNYDWGLLNIILRSLGFTNLIKSWLGNTKTALPCLIVATTWMWTGFNMVILLAAMHSIPSEIIEASKIDGASDFQVILNIIIPLLRSTIANLVVLCFIGKMRVFDIVWVTTHGGPLWATETVATYMYKRAFTWDIYDLGYPSAVSTFWFIITFIISIFLGKIIRGTEVYKY